MSKLVIVESPAKAKTIGKYLGPDYTVKASMGHLRDLPRKTMGVDLEHDFKPEYIPIEGKDKLISELRKAAKETQVQVAAAIGVTEQYYQKLEYGENLPGIENAWKLADHFGVTVDYLIGRSDER